MWLIGSPTAAGILAVAVFVAMLSLRMGPALIATVTVVVILQTTLMVGRGVYLRRSGRPADRPVRCHQFLSFWLLDRSLSR